MIWFDCSAAPDGHDVHDKLPEKKNGPDRPRHDCVVVGPSAPTTSDFRLPPTARSMGPHRPPILPCPRIESSLDCNKLRRSDGGSHVAVLLHLLHLLFTHSPASRRRPPILNPLHTHIPKPPSPPTQAEAFLHFRSCVSDLCEAGGMGHGRVDGRRVLGRFCLLADGFAAHEGVVQTARSGGSNPLVFARCESNDPHEIHLAPNRREEKNTN